MKGCAMLLAAPRARPGALQFNSLGLPHLIDAAQHGVVMGWFKPSALNTEQNTATRRFQVPVAVARVLVRPSSLVATMRHTASSAARNMATDFSEWIVAAADLWRQEALEWLE